MNITCKHCGSDKGFYIKTHLWARINTYFNNDGSLSEENGNPCDSLIEERGKNAYCISCDKVICKVEEIEDELEN